MKGISFIPSNTKINFVGLRYVAFFCSAVLVFGSIFLMFSRGLNFGIDFSGGTMMEIKVGTDQPDLAALRSDLNSLNLGGILIQEFGEADDLLIRIPQQANSAEEESSACKEDAAKNKDAVVRNSDACQTPDQKAIAQVREALDKRFAGADGKSGVDYRRIEFVGPQVGSELKREGLEAILLALLGIMGYVWLRFEWQFSLAGMLALAHDTIATIGLFSLTGMEFNLSTLAAILMIAGYSINDTVVVFDRIRETLRKYKKKPLGEIINLAINDTLSRTTMTSFTTLLALIALYMFGGEVIRGFVYALIFGIVVGTYSSIFVASPILLLMKIRRGAFDEKPDDAAGGAEQGA